MEKLRIVVDRIETSSDGFASWSILYVMADTMCFPDDEWWDATSSVLTIWADNMYKLLCGSSNSIELPYMDGDYAIGLTKTETGETIAIFASADKAVVIETPIDIVYFGRQILAAVEKIKIHHGNYVDLPKVVELVDTAEKLRTIIKDLR